jgi:hypothetical protein
LCSSSQDFFFVVSGLELSWSCTCRQALYLMSHASSHFGWPWTASLLPRPPTYLAWTTTHSLFFETGSH